MKTRTCFFVSALGGLLLLSACDSADETPSGTTTGSGGSGGTGGTVSYADPYTIAAFDNERIGSDSAEPNFHNIEAAVDFHDPPFASVTLIVDLATTCFPFESWQDNPPPPGEYWPADCDAFDRNFELSLDEPASESEPPAIELLRAITPFGGPQHLEVDITDVANGLPGEHTLRAHISTWSDGAGQVTGSNGGWNVSASIAVVPGPPPRHVLAVIPLYNGNQTTLQGPGPLTFTAPEATAGARIEYRATGHGGAQVSDPACIGPAEEFCRRTHTLSVDQQEAVEQELWRTNCYELCTVEHYGPPDAGFDYCLENPCGAIGSVVASRANWCPGSVTPPLVIEPAWLASPGEHSFEWQISELHDGGSWRLSATFFAFE